MPWDCWRPTAQVGVSPQGAHLFAQLSTSLGMCFWIGWIDLVEWYHGNLHAFHDRMRHSILAHDLPSSYDYWLLGTSGRCFSSLWSYPEMQFGSWSNHMGHCCERIAGSIGWWTMFAMFLAFQPNWVPFWASLNDLQLGIFCMHVLTFPCKPKNRGFPDWILDVLAWKSNIKENYCLQLHARDPNARLGAPNESREGTPHQKKVDSTLSCAGNGWLDYQFIYRVVFGWLMGDVGLSQNGGWIKNLMPWNNHIRSPFNFEICPYIIPTNHCMCKINRYLLSGSYVDKAGR